MLRIGIAGPNFVCILNFYSVKLPSVEVVPVYSLASNPRSIGFSTLLPIQSSIKFTGLWQILNLS